MMVVIPVCSFGRQIADPRPSPESYAHGRGYVGAAPTEQMQSLTSRQRASAVSEERASQGGEASTAKKLRSCHRLIDQDCRKPMRNAPQWRPRTLIGDERSFIRTNLPPPMSRR